jgi:hypothetical protein
MMIAIELGDAPCERALAGGGRTVDSDGKMLGGSLFGLILVEKPLPQRKEQIGRGQDKCDNRRDADGDEGKAPHRRHHRFQPVRQVSRQILQKRIDSQDQNKLEYEQPEQKCKQPEANPQAQALNGIWNGNDSKRRQQKVH